LGLRAGTEPGGGRCGRFEVLESMKRKLEVVCERLARKAGDAARFEVL
jgi:hypothetical protein